MLPLPVAADFASALSLLAVIVWSIPSLRRLLPDMGIGALFGGVALLQMHAPIEMEAGVIIDLRCVTVALAAALLRPSGVVACVVAAAAARLHIGGVGAPAGIVAILLAAGGAHLWVRVMAGRALRPGWQALVVLGGATCTHLLSVPLLPSGTAERFVREAGPWLALSNVVAVPLLAAIGFRGTHAPLGREAWLDRSTGLLSAFGLRASFLQREAADLPSRGTGLTLLRLRHGRWTTRTFGDSTVDAAMGALRARLDAVLPREAMVARLGPCDIAVLWPDIDEVGHRAVSMGLARATGAGPVALPDGYSLSVPLDSADAWTRIDADLDALLSRVRGDLRPAGRRPSLAAAAV